MFDFNAAQVDLVSVVPSKAAARLASHTHTHVSAAAATTVAAAMPCMKCVVERNRLAASERRGVKYGMQRLKELLLKHSATDSDSNSNKGYRFGIWRVVCVCLFVIIMRLRRNYSSSPHITSVCGNVNVHLNVC